MPCKNQNFKGVSINKKLYESIEHFVEDYPEYRSVADFVSEATRVRMDQLRQKSRRD